MNDQYGNSMLVTVRVTVNLRTFDIYAVRVTNIEFWGRPGG
jgi:hypothetical protein